MAREKSALHKVFRLLRKFEDSARTECGFAERCYETEKLRVKMVEAMWQAVEEANQQGLQGMKLKERKR